MLKPILLVEDDARDLELTLVALERSQLANEVVVVRDGAQALDYLLRQGDHATQLFKLKYEETEGALRLAEYTRRGGGVEGSDLIHCVGRRGRTPAAAR